MKVVLIGAGGYGVKYVDYLLENKDFALTLAGVVEPYYDACARREAIDGAGIPVYASPEEFYAADSAQLAVVCTPPFLHAEQSVCALRHGSYVLCEKPVAPTPGEVERMREAEKAYGKWIAVGYQWSFSDAIQALKRDVLSGRFGKPILLRTIVSWPRSKAYYGRGVGWAGKLQKDGVVIWDSIASNACAHYIHNMLFLLGNGMRTSALPLHVEAELLRANNIETFDTCLLRMEMKGGATAYFAASHAADEVLDPQFVYTFEKAIVSYEQGEIAAVFPDGTRVSYGDPFRNEMKKIDDCAAAIRRGTLPACGVETASAHTALMAGLHKNLAVTEFPRESIGENEKKVWVRGLCAMMRACYRNASLFSEIGVPYARKIEFSLSEGEKI